MPVMYVEPEEFMTTARDVLVFHNYGERLPVMRSLYHYQVQADDFESGFAAFDVRDLTREAGLHVSARESAQEIREVIQAAEDAFDLPLDEVLRQNDLWSEGNG